MSATQLFRSCTASLSLRSIARPARISSIRYYSTQDPVTDASKPSADTTEPPPEPQNDALRAKEAEVVDLTSRLRYLQADFLNLQRNAAREKEQTKDFAVTRFASDLLETVDVLSLALKSVPASALVAPDAASDGSASSPLPIKTADAHLRELYTGVEMTQRQLLSTLFKYHVKPFDPTGEKFDPNRHEALFQMPASEGKPPGTVAECLKTGYMIKDRVLRAAQVGVAQES